MKDFLRIFFLFSGFFPVFYGFFRILISCSNFDLKKINFLFLYFVKKLFIFYIYIFLFFYFSAKFSTKKLFQFWKFPKVIVPEPAFSYYSLSIITVVACFKFLFVVVGVLFVVCVCVLCDVF